MKLVFATNNKNKLKEVQALLPGHIKLLSLEEIGCKEEIPETSETIEGNAQQKADYVKQNYGYDCFADDTGLEVNALNGAPGIFSARYAGPEKDANANMKKLLEKLMDSDDRNANFKTVIALNYNNESHQFTGICKGSIITQTQGDGGFGYDPIFQPEKYNQTFAELPLSEKNKIGHRGKAVKSLIDFLNN